MQVEVGDIVYVENESFFPADLLLLSSRYVCLHIPIPNNLK